MKVRFTFLVFFISSLVFSQAPYSILSISPELTKNSNSVVLEENIFIDATNIRKMKITTRRVVAVLGKSGNGDVRAYEFYNENSRVRKIEAEVFDALGNRIRRFKKKDFKDVSRTDGSMYLDSRVVFLDYTPVSYPYIMVYESEVESGDSGLINDVWFLKGYAESLAKTETTIRFAADNKIRYKGKNLEELDIMISESPNELTIKANNIPAFRYEEYSPSESEILPHVLLSFNQFQLKNVVAKVNTWEDFGSWMNNALLADVNDISPQTIAEINRLIADETTNEGKARKIYQYVQDKVRYVSIQIGIGGWKPMPASEVDKLSYGDCKALTNYTKVLLDAVGIPSYYTIVYGSRTKRNLDPDFASIQGNHAILGIPDGDEITWLECTSQDLPFGYIGSATDDRNVVMITPEGGKLTRTKAYKAAENTQETEATVRIHSTGLVTAKFESTSKGLQYEDKYFLPKRKESEVDRFYKNRWSHINGFSISDLKFENNTQEIAFQEELILRMTNYLTSVGNDYLFMPNVFNQINHVPPQISNREQNLKINRGFLDVDRVIIELPPDLTTEALPESVSLNNKFGSYEISFTEKSDRKIEYNRKFRLNEGEFPPEDYEAYREFLRNISRLDRTKILLTHD